MEKGQRKQSAGASAWRTSCLAINQLEFCVEHVEAKRYQKVLDHRRPSNRLNWFTPLAC